MLDVIKQEAFWAWRKLKKFRKLQRPIMFPPNLCGMCAIGSVGLYKRLSYDLKIEQVKLVVGSYVSGWTYAHCWIKYNDYIVDITASQFDTIRNSIIVDLEENSFYLDIFKNRTELTELNDIKQYFIHQGWVPAQQPFIDGRKKLKFRV